MISPIFFVKLKKAVAGCLTMKSDLDSVISIPQTESVVAMTFISLLTKLSSMVDIYYLPFLVAHVLLYLGLVHTSAYSRWRYSIVAAIIACCSIAVRSQFSLGIPGSAGGQYIWGMMM